MNNKRSNFTRIYFIGMAIIIIVMLYYAGSGLKSNNYKYNDLLNDLQNGKVTQLNISQKKEVPTGKVTVKLQDGSTKYVYITDVNQVISDIKDIKTKAKENAKNKYKKKIDNTKFDLIDAFDGPEGAALKEKLEEKIIRENSKMNNNRNIKRPGK